MLSFYYSLGTSSQCWANASPLLFQAYLFFEQNLAIGRQRAKVITTHTRLFIRGVAPDCD